MYLLLGFQVLVEHILYLDHLDLLVSVGFHLDLLELFLEREESLLLVFLVSLDLLDRLDIEVSQLLELRILLVLSVHIYLVVSKQRLQQSQLHHELRSLLFQLL